MTFLLDTNVFLWWLADDNRISLQAKEYIGNEKNDVMVSAASMWEISIKKSLKKLEVDHDLAEELGNNDFIPLPITVEHALAVEHLDSVHGGDPFDRLLIAQAQHERMTFLTGDKRLMQYDAEVVVV